MRLIFLGTSSSKPTPTRGHSSLALILPHQTFLFDAGEGTQLQITKSSVNPTKITHIFITHLHGDHIFGLCPLLASLHKVEKLNIYGPRGIAELIRVTLRLSQTPLEGSYQVHEMDIGNEQNTQYRNSVREDSVLLKRSREEDSSEDMHLGIQPIKLQSAHLRSERQSEADSCGISDIGPEMPVTRIPISNHAQSRNSYYVLPHIEGFDITAHEIKHTIPCLGYVLQEHSHPGKIEVNAYQQRLQTNKTALAAIGVTNPMSLLKELQAGNDVTLPDGDILKAPPHRRGRKLVILGDTCDPSNVIPFAQGADVLIHESTNAYLPRDPSTRPEDSYESVMQKCIEHGHSTAQMAGAFAKRIEAKHLYLNHFSSRYKGVGHEDLMEDIRRLAADAFGSNNVVCATDWMSAEIVRSNETVSA